MLNDQFIFFSLVFVLLIDHCAIDFFIILLFDVGQGDGVRGKNRYVFIGQLLGISLRVCEVDQGLIESRFLGDLPKFLKAIDLLTF